MYKHELPKVVLFIAVLALIMSLAFFAGVLYSGKPGTIMAEKPAPQMTLCGDIADAAYHEKMMSGEPIPCFWTKPQTAPAPVSIP